MPLRESNDLTSSDRDNAQRRVEEQLREAIDTLRTDMARVELWAYALVGFARPVPDYEHEKFRLGSKPKPASKNP